MKKNKAAILVHLKLNSQRLKGKNFKLLNNNSIGIEISNPGHDHKYKKFSKSLNKSHKV